MADTNDLFRKEVEEELRKERYEEIWKSYGIYIIAAAAALVFSVAGYNFWQSSKLSAAQTNGASYENAMQLAKDGKDDEALKAFQLLADNASTGYRDLAQLQIAGTQNKLGKTSEALETLSNIASSSNVDPLFKDYAKLQLAALKVGTDSFTEIKNRLNDLAGDDHPFRYSARELIGLAAFKAGKISDARNYYQDLIANSSIPRGIAQRAEIMLGQIMEMEMAGTKSAPTSGAKPSTPSPSTQSTPATNASATTDNSASTNASAKSEPAPEAQK